MRGYATATDHAIESIDATFAEMERRAVRSSVRLVDYRLPSGEVVGVRFDEGEHRPAVVTFALASGAIVYALRVAL